jgi:hypothetical protein
MLFTGETKEQHACATRIHSRRFCKRNAEETIHAPIRGTNECCGIYMDLGMRNISYV